MILKNKILDFVTWLKFEMGIVSPSRIVIDKEYCEKYYKSLEKEKEKEKELMNLITFLDKYLVQSDTVNYNTSPRYALGSNGYLSTGTMTINYEVSIENLVERYQWIVGKYTTCLAVYYALMELGYKFVQDLPLRNAGVYATWKNKPQGLFLL